MKGKKIKMVRYLSEMARYLLLILLVLGAAACYLGALSTHQVAPIGDAAIANAKGNIQQALIREKQRREHEVVIHKMAFVALGTIDLAALVWIVAARPHKSKKKALEP